MNLLHLKKIFFALIMSSSAISFGMEQESLPLTALSPSSMPRELHHNVFSKTSSLISQDRLRSTCHYWKNIVDDKNPRAHLLNLLHAPSHATQDTKTRVLFDAIYNGDYDLAEHIVNHTPPTDRLYFRLRSFGPELLDPYVIAKHIRNPHMVTLLEKHGYDKPKYGVTKEHNQPIPCRKTPSAEVLVKLLICSISGDSNSVSAIINTELKEPHNYAQLIDAEKDKYANFTTDTPWSHQTEFTIEDAFNVIVYHDDNACAPSIIKFIDENQDLEWWSERFLRKACECESKKIFETLLKQKKNINKKMFGSSNGRPATITLKNELLGINWHSNISSKSPEYYAEIEAILNACGAKTYEELQKDASQASNS